MKPEIEKLFTIYKKINDLQNQRTEIFSKIKNLNNKLETLINYRY